MTGTTNDVRNKGPFEVYAHSLQDALCGYADHCRVRVQPCRSGGWQARYTWRSIQFLTVSYAGAPDAPVIFYPNRNFHKLRPFLQQQAESLDHARRIRPASFLPYLIQVEQAFEVSHAELLQTCAKHEGTEVIEMTEPAGFYVRFLMR